MLSCKGKALEFLSQKHICKQIFLCELEFDVKFFDHGFLLFCRQLNEKDKDLEKLHKKLESECDDYTQQIEDIKTDLVHVQQELLALRTECEHKDKQINMLNVQLVEAETLTQDVMHDLHSVKLDISNYASLVSQQQLELISERARHSDEAQEKVAFPLFLCSFFR
jgi:chromosome segregation ATPase